MWVLLLPEEPPGRHEPCVGVSPRSLAFIFGNRVGAQSGEYFLEGCRNKQPASKAAAQGKTGRGTGRVPDPGCRAQTGLSVPPICPVCGGALLSFSKGNRGVGPLQALELQRRWLLTISELNWKIRPVAYKTGRTLPARDKWGPTATGG